MSRSPSTTSRKLTSRPAATRRAAVERAYDIVAAEYDKRLAGSSRFDEMFIASELRFMLDGVDRGTTVLDLGCGTGRLSLAAADRGADVIGIDISRQMLRQAAAKAKRGRPRFTWADMTALPFPDSRFDMVISSLAMTHLHPNRRTAAFTEAARVLRVGGMLVVAVKNSRLEDIFPNRFVTADLIDAPGHKLIFDELSNGRQVEVPWYSFSPDELKACIGAAGLRLISLRGNVPLAAWIADQALENDVVRAAVNLLEHLLGNLEPLNCLGWYTMARATKFANGDLC